MRNVEGHAFAGRGECVADAAGGRSVEACEIAGGLGDVLGAGVERRCEGPRAGRRVIGQADAYRRCAQIVEAGLGDLLGDLSADAEGPVADVG